MSFHDTKVEIWLVKVCEHTFEAEDPAHPGYSLAEVDLFPAVGSKGEAYSIRENKEADVYEIFNFRADEPYTDDAVFFEDGSLDRVLEEANRLERLAEGSGSFEYGHQPYRDGCPIDEIYL